jgi:hypothetical protein
LTDGHDAAVDILRSGWWLRYFLQLMTGVWCEVQRKLANQIFPTPRMGLLNQPQHKAKMIK